MSATVTMQGNVMELDGQQVKVGRKAPDFTVLDNNLAPKSLKDYAGKVLVLASVPSLDTPVCDMEVRRFNTEAAALSKDVQILAISCDLPFAQARWCGAAGVEAVQTLSDHYNVDFGMKYGVLLKPLRLLTRAVFVVDKKGDIVHAQIVPEATNEPDYAAVLSAVKQAL